MKQNQYEIIVLDLDGTLTNRDKVITPRTKKALMEAQARGKKVVLASGRPTQGVMPLAEELDLPVIFHDREAHGDSLAIVREFPQVRGVFHCYSGSLEDAKTLIRLGWNLSFTGSVTYKNAKKLPEVAAWVPEDRFMIETDSPYLLPYPRVKGEKRNDSSKLPRIAAKIAALRGLTEAEVEHLTTENGKAFFRLP